jgi:tRNA dimethylallyltransferase
MDFLLEELGEARAVLIAGPTASGKSALALQLAERAAAAGRPAVLVNADSMQVYDALAILTARPSASDAARAPHRLYGHVRAATRYSVGAWLRDAVAELARAAVVGALPIVVGGTGLYFKALTEGLAATPDIPAELRAHWARRFAGEGAVALHAELAARDPDVAATLRPGDGLRILRALEIFDATGRSLADWQAEPTVAPLASAGTLRVVLDPPREALYRRIEARHDAMIAAGGVDEVRTLLALGLSPDLPVMKAIGVRELAAHLNEGLPLAEAIARAKMETRRYAKRQLTFFRNQMPGWQRREAPL